MKPVETKELEARLERLAANAPLVLPEEASTDTAPEDLWTAAPPSQSMTWGDRLSLCRVPKKFAEAVPHEHELPDYLTSWTGDPWSVLLHGPVGTGKTFIAVRLLGHFGETHGKSGYFADCALAVEEMGQEISRGESGQLLDRMKHAGVLLLDDLGAERHTSEFARDKLGVVLRFRYNELQPTIVTSNLPLREPNPSIRSLYPQLYSRLREGLVRKLEGVDRRTTSEAR